VRPDSLETVTPAGMPQGSDAWLSRDGSLLAVPGPLNQWLPPAPEQVEIFQTAALFSTTRS
jgi:hypothetical protein